MCDYPRLIRNRKYIANKKNGGIVPAVTDIRVMAVPVACGECMTCRKKKAREWQIRLKEDIKHNRNAKFVTLTFSNKSIKEIVKIIRENDQTIKGYELDNKIATIAIRRFLERWRKKFKKSLRHWLVTELGGNGTENIHLHGLIFTNEIEELKKIWGYGHIWEGQYVSNRTINYIVKYITKRDEKHKYYKSKILTSAGIGNSYVDEVRKIIKQYKPQKTKETYKTETGHEVGMPVYWRNKLWTDEEKEKLWIEKLDSNTRWVGNRKIDVSNGMEEYNKALKKQQKRGKEKGYGDGVKDWNEKKYEEQRRTLLQQKRIREANA